MLGYGPGRSGRRAPDQRAGPQNPGQDLRAGSPARRRASSAYMPPPTNDWKAGARLMMSPRVRRPNSKAKAGRSSLPGGRRGASRRRPCSRLRRASAVMGASCQGARPCQGAAGSVAHRRWTTASPGTRRRSRRGRPAPGAGLRQAHVVEQPVGPVAAHVPIAGLQQADGAAGHVDHGQGFAAADQVAPPLGPQAGGDGPGAAPAGSISAAARARA